jgi:chemotaxis protein CheZ
VAGVNGSKRDIGVLIQAAVRAELTPIAEDLRRFVDRRIAELSAEIHGATQLMDFSEANLSGQLGRIQEEIGRIVGAPVAATRNSGLELEVVVQATEAAANQILEAAEAIGTWVQQGVWDPASVEAVTERLNTIFEACTFQDLTGQRIRRAIEHLQGVEAMLGGLTHADTPEPAAVPEAAADLAQDDVDRLFG